MNSMRNILPRSLGAWSRLIKSGNTLIRALLILVVLSPLTSRTAYSQMNKPSALPVWNKLSVDAPPYITNMTDRSLAFDPIYNTPCMAYGGDALYYSCWDWFNSKWWSVVLDNSADVGQYAALRFNSYGYPFITYYDAHYGRLKMVYFNGVTWVYLIAPNVDGFLGMAGGSSAQAGSQDLNANPPGPIPDSDFIHRNNKAVAPSAPSAQTLPPPTSSVASVPSNDESVVDHSDPNEQPAPADEPSILERIDQVVKSWSGNSPQFPIQPVIGYGKYSSIAIDNTDGIHISYYDEIDGSLEYLYWDGITWHGKVVDDYSDQGDVGLWSSIAVDPAQFVHIAYYSDKYDDLKYARRNAAGGWETWTVDSVNNVGVFSSIAVETYHDFPGPKAFYRPHISYYDFTGDNLKYAYLQNNELWHTQVLDSNGMTGWYTSIAVDYSSLNRIWISYYKASTGDLKVAKYDGSVWSIRSLDQTGATKIGLFTSIDLDIGQHPAIAYIHASYGALKFIYSPKSSGWNTPSWVTYFTRDVGLSTSLAITPGGVPYISYLDATAGALKVAYPTTSGWALQYLFNYPYSGMYSSIDTAGEFPMIAYYQQQYKDLRFALPLGWLGFWISVPVDQTYDVGQYISMKTNPSTGLPHMAYYDATHADLVYATPNLTFTDWMTRTLDSQGTVGWYPSLALGRQNVSSPYRPFISYYNATTGSLMLAYQSPTLTWVSEAVDNIGQLSETGVGAYTAVAVDNLGRPHISYYDVTNKQLKYAYWDGDWYATPRTGTWNISVVDINQDTGRFSSLVIDQATNTSHICYYDYTNGNLKYAQGSPGNPWQTQTVDGNTGPYALGGDNDSLDEGDVGLYCSIDLTTTGLPAISYYDNSHGDLKFAYASGYTPAPSPLFSGVVFMPLILK